MAGEHPGRDEPMTISSAGPGWVGSYFQGKVSVLVAINPGLQIRGGKGYFSINFWEFNIEN